MNANLLVSPTDRRIAELAEKIKKLEEEVASLSAEVERNKERQEGDYQYLKGQIANLEGD